MLVRLYGSNFRSFKGDFELSMVAADLTNEDDRNRGVIQVPINGMDEPLNLLRVAAIYGPNASGKSTVLMAGRALRLLVRESSRSANPDATIPLYTPFLLDSESQGSSIKLGCDVVHGRSLLNYELCFGPKTIEQEKLVLFDDGSEVALIDRNASGDVQGELIAKSAANQLYVKGMQPNVSVLSKLAQHGPQRGDDSVLPYYSSVTGALEYLDYSAIAAMRRFGATQDDRFADDSAYREWIMAHLMRTADVGICNVKTQREAIDVPRAFLEAIEKENAGTKFPTEQVLVSFVHTGNSNRPLDFSDESAGTRKLFNISDEWWRLAHTPFTLLADELGASLHPTLLDRLIRAVNEPPSPESRSQLIFTTHETGLLESHDGLPPALRRDQVYFTKKDAKGDSELYSLTEFKDDARPVHNLRKRYLSGKYGALPAVDRLSL